MRPARVRFSHHAERRIRQRRLDHRHISSLMYNLPYEEGKHYYDPPETGMRLVFVDQLRMRTVITAIDRDY